ncbi:MAG: hypothetical protein IKP73_08225 [Bacteroidales bacterium]|nr:hypothetical protein [Bacteroidales bacterium]
MSLTNGKRNQICSKIENLLSGDVSVSFCEADGDDTYEYSAYFDDIDDYWENCNNGRIDKQVAKIFRNYGGEMGAYDGDSSTKTLWWQMQEY